MSAKPAVGLFPQLLLDVHEELIVDLFAGGGGASLGIEMATGRQVDVAVNHDAAAVALHEANHPQTRHLTSDVFEVDPRAVTQGRPVGLLWASPDCFPAGTLILTEHGYRPIEEIGVGDRVLTHKGRYRLVAETMISRRPMVVVRGQGHPGLVVSREHPIYTREASNTWNEQRRIYRRTLGDPKWTKAAELQTAGAPLNAKGGSLSFWATPCQFPELPIPHISGRGLPTDERLMWLAGRYLGDGWTRLSDTRAELVITCANDEAEGLRLLLDLWPRTGSRSRGGELAWHERETKTAHQLSTNHRGLVEWLRAEFGHRAEAKHLPGWALGMATPLREALLAGYVSADGHTRTVSGSDVTICSSVSKALMLGIRALAESLGRSAYVSGPYGNRSVIQGRRVNARPVWDVKWRHKLQRSQNVRDDLHNWTRVQSVEELGTAETVFNLSVEEDESYVAEGVVVHNCTDHSKAKGGKPMRDASRKRRALAWVVTRWAGQVRPRVICLENVEEFAQWGPLVAARDKATGRVVLGPKRVQRRGRRTPVRKQLLQRCPRRKRRTFRSWVRSLERLGYVVEWRELRACDYGAPTIRKRLFVVARCDGRPIVWPEPTHGPGRRLPYRTAAECIDWSVPMLSIFATRAEARAWGKAHGQAPPIRPLAAATMRRIARGVQRFVLDNPRPFLVTLNHGGGRDHAPRGLHDPLRTVAASRDAHALVAPVIAGVGGRAGQSPERPGDAPLGTITAKGDAALVAPFMVPRYSEREGQEPRTRSIEEPAPVVVPTGNGGSLVAAHLSTYYGEKRPGDGRGAELEEPLATQTTENRHALVAAFLARHWGGMVGKELAEPHPTILTKGAQDQLAAVHLTHQYTSNTRGGNGDPHQPAKTVTTGGHHGLVYSFLQRYNGQGIGQAPDSPLQTLSTKDRMGLVTVDVQGEPYVIADIAMRMLQPRELFRAQGFPDSYRIDRAGARIFTKTEQVRLVGNSVSPQVARALVRANCPELRARDEVAA